jgi:MYXO-CTERM domain-containing protein
MVGAGHHIVMDDFVLNVNGPGNGSPELSTWMLLACSGLAGLVIRRRRRS